MDPVLVRAATDGDLPQLTELYNYYVNTSPATFDLAPVTLENRREWKGHYADSGPHRLLVAEAGGAVAGYALYRLRTSFGRFTGDQARLAYATSALAVGRIIDEAGGFAIANLLRDLGEGVEFETAFAHRIQRSLADFQAAIQ